MKCVGFHTKSIREPYALFLLNYIESVEISCCKSAEIPVYCLSESAALRAGTAAVRGFRTVSELDRSSTQVDLLRVVCKPGSERRAEM